ncbi:hypothetical protein [Rhodanobacter sp. MP1X3]|uniref:hypothetical protein n=1 Tax=Rhodanobacter sp. MP1X3 TaxID=2723086 RepID=UPI0016150CCD|nr:hypothetical protein [Rhodanobacter sp. MP1X3]MBB6243158.1 hypothetical protein [Rhodanobacter sp. MP1X3]
MMVVPPVMAQSSFQGDWLYQQTCGWKHSADLHLTQQGNEVKGHWGDGTARGHGDSGSLQGTLKGKKLLVGYCNDDPASNDGAICPNFDKDQPDYYVLRGDELDWYQKFGDKHRKYLTLHREIKGKKTPTDDHCPDDDQ